MACEPNPREPYCNPRDLGLIPEPLRSIMHTAIVRSPRGGLILVSGKRNDTMQWDLRHERTPGHECGPMSLYPGHPRTAIPGKSKHRNLNSDICAVDFGGIDMQWLRDNATNLGIYLAVPGENWHFQLTGRKPIWDIIPFNAPPPKPQNPNKLPGHDWVGFRPGDFDGVNGSIYKRGGYDNEVAEIQIRLTIVSASWRMPKLNPGPIDGIYGKKLDSPTRLATLEFHRVVKATMRPEWPAPDPIWGTKKRDVLRWFSA